MKTIIAILFLISFGNTVVNSAETAFRNITIVFIPNAKPAKLFESKEAGFKLDCGIKLFKPVLTPYQIAECWWSNNARLFTNINLFCKSYNVSYCILQ